mgnify:FL=1
MSSEFLSLLPLSEEDLLARERITDACNVCWCNAQTAVSAYWGIRRVGIEISVQEAPDMSYIGLGEGTYELFQYEGISPECVCALSPRDRAVRNSMPFLRTSCDFATITVDGPYLREGAEIPDDFAKWELGFKIDFYFAWRGITLRTGLDTPPTNLIGGIEAGIIGGTSVNAYAYALPSDDYISYIRPAFGYLYD